MEYMVDDGQLFHLQAIYPPLYACKVRMWGTPS